MRRDNETICTCGGSGGGGTVSDTCFNDGPKKQNASQKCTKLSGVVMQQYCKLFTVRLYKKPASECFVAVFSSSKLENVLNLSRGLKTL